MTDTHSRHFLALLPDPEACARLVAVPLPAGGRAVHAEDLHVTLAFLGDLPDLAPDTLMDLLTASWRRGPVEVVLDGLECWRGARVVCAVGEGAAGLADDLRRCLEGLGHRHEPRPFRAHVTLERGLPAAACDIAPQALQPAIRWTSRTLYLLASRTRPLGSGQSRYEILASRPLL